MLINIIKWDRNLITTFFPRGWYIPCIGSTSEICNLGFHFRNSTSRSPHALGPALSPPPALLSPMGPQVAMSASSALSWHPPLCLLSMMALPLCQLRPFPSSKPHWGGEGFPDSPPGTCAGNWFRVTTLYTEFIHIGSMVCSVIFLTEFPIQHMTCPVLNAQRPPVPANESSAQIKWQTGWMSVPLDL